MRHILLLTTILIPALNLYGSTIIVSLSFEYKDEIEIEYLVSRCRVENAKGETLAKTENFGPIVRLTLPDSFEGNVNLFIEEYSYFPIQIPLTIRRNESIEVKGILCVPVLRQKLPRNATCGTFAPRKKDIPRKIPITINAQKFYLVPDKEGVSDLTYIVAE